MENNLENDANSNEFLILYGKVAGLEAAHNAFKESVDGDLKEIKDKVSAFHDEMTRYRGFVGALTLIGSGLTVFVSLFKDKIFNLFS